MSFQNHINLQTLPMGASDFYPPVSPHTKAAGIWKSLYHRDGWEMENFLDITAISK